MKLRLKGINFRPDVRLKAAMTGVSVTQSKYSRHSPRLSEVAIDMRLKEKEGKLANVGRCMQPIYRPQPGYYGRSREEADQR